MKNEIQVTCPKTCGFVLRAGAKKGLLCGKSCRAAEGEKSLCHKHKEANMNHSKEQMKNKYDSGLYVTKNKQLEMLREDVKKNHDGLVALAEKEKITSQKTQEQENQIAMLSEDLQASRIQIAELKTALCECAPLGAEIVMLRKELANKTSLPTSNAIIEEVKMQKKEIYLQKQINESMVQKIKDLMKGNETTTSACMKYVQQVKQESIQREQILKKECEENVRKCEIECGVLISNHDKEFFAVFDEYKKTLMNMQKQLLIVSSQCKELTATTIRKTTKDQLVEMNETNRKGIEGIRKNLAESMKNPMLNK